MTSDLTSTTLKTYFRFPFSGPGWQNRLLIGVGVTFANYIVPFLPSLLVGGYLLRVLRQTSSGDAPALPEWDDWGGMLLNGLKAVVVQIVYLLPAYVLMFGGIAAYIGSFVFLPIMLGISSAGGREPSGAAGAVMVLVMFLSLGIMFLAIALSFIFMALGAIPLPVALSRLAVTGRLGAAFELRQVFRLLRANKLGYLIAWVISAGVLYLTTMLVVVLYYSIVLMCLAPFIMMPLVFLTGLIAAALFGDSYAQAAAALEPGN